MEMKSGKFKMILPLLVHYVHTGSDQDFPVRLIVSFSSHFEMGGKDADVLLTKNDQVFPFNQNSVWGKDYGYHLLNLQVSPKIRKSNISTKISPMLSENSSLIISVVCRMYNDHGRESWRNGGTCQITLAELFVNQRLSDKYYKGTIFTRRRICISGYNVPESDRLTGVVSLALNPQTTTTTTTTLFNLSDKWEIWMKCYISDKSNKDVCFLLSNQRETPINQNRNLDLLRFFQLLFGYSLISNEAQFYQTISLKDHPTWGWSETQLKNNSNNRNEQNNQFEIWRKNVENNWAQYTSMLSSMNYQMLKTDVPGTERMRCPYTPMDTVVKEFSWDYSEPWSVTRNGIPNDMGDLIGSSQRNDTFLPPKTKSITHNINLAEKHLWLGNKRDLKDLKIESHYTVKYSPGSNQNRIGGKSNLLFSSCYSEIRNTFGGQFVGNFESYDFMSSLVSNDPEICGTTLYLPFPFFLNHQPLKVHKNYWGLALILMIRRLSHPTQSIVDYESFESAFFNEKLTPPHRKAGLAFNLIVQYCQAIEYISDYYTAKGNNKRRDKKVDIEQFGNCQRNMAGDCEDLAGGILQFYCNFVSDDQSRSWVQNISNNKVLSEMRRILRHNYIPIFSIDGVYLCKQTGDTENKNDATMYQKGMVETEEEIQFLKHVNSYTQLSNRQKEMVNNFRLDSQNVDSAHASVKILPKKYFEECVNRSYSHCDEVQYNRYQIKPNHRNMKEGPFKTSCTSDKECLCFYHKYSPDPYNLSLPVGFLEGTSMGCPDENMEDTCKDEAFKEHLLSDPILSDITKVPIYANKKGESNFYKISFFGSMFTPGMSFLQQHNVATFAWCRVNEKSLGKNAFNEKLFLRSVSHKQLVFKSDKVVLLPYGHQVITKEHLLQLQQNPSRQGDIKFDFSEMTQFTKDLCFHECSGRMRSRKVRRTKKFVHKDIYQGPITSGYQYKSVDIGSDNNSEHNGVASSSTTLRDFNKNITNVIEYNTQLHDSGRSLKQSEILLAKWKDRLNHTYNTSNRPIHPNRGFFTIYWDNYYITNELLKKVENNIHFSVRRQKHTRGSNWTECFEVFFILEVHSDDVCLWKIDFVLK